MSRSLCRPFSCFGLFLPLVLLAWGFSGCAVQSDDELIDIGVARIDITPPRPVRLHGFPRGARAEDISAVTLPIAAQAMVIGSDEEDFVVLITTGLLGVSAEMTHELATRLNGRIGLSDASRLTLTATHTHSAPALTTVAPFIFRTPPTAEQAQHIVDYETWLMDRLVEVAVAAMADRQPAHLAIRRGAVGFAENRRVLEKGKWKTFGVNVKGPVDHALPLLTATSEAGELRAAWVNYACHGVCWQGPSVHGDWPGAAMQEIENRHPDAVAFVTIGCAGDQNPIGVKDNKAGEHGRTIAEEVDRLLGLSAQPLVVVPTVQRLKFDLPLGEREDLSAWEKRTDWYSEFITEKLKTGASVETTLPYVVQTWVWGDELAMVFLAGEVVIDYTVRLKDELDGDRLWVTAYANAAPAYIPSARMITSEGGYEVDASRFSYGVPAPLAAEAEDLIIDTVRGLLPVTFERTAVAPSTE